MEKIRFKDYLIDYLEFYNITQKDFAKRIDITPKHLVDILSGKSDLSFQVIDNIGLVTGISVDYIHRVEANYRLELKIEDYLKKENTTLIKILNKFDYKYLIKENYIDFIDVSNDLDILKDILKFLRVSSPSKIYELEENILYKSKNNKPELLLLWLEKCYKETLKQKVSKYKKENINKIVEYIINSAKKEVFNEQELIKYFNTMGIYLVIEDDMPGSKIRGAFKVHKNTPAIYLTRKHQRIADIYFALLHELAHCKTDFNKAKSESLVSYDTDINDVESKADEQAYNSMVNDKYYNEVCIKQNYNIHNEDKYPKSFVVYRLAKDKIIKYSSKEYQEYNILI